MVDYNLEILNANSLQSSFFHLSRNDPTIGFHFDCTKIAGHTVPEHQCIHASKTPIETSMDRDPNNLYMRLLIGSHLAQYLRHQLEEHQGYSSTVGISTSKLISKLVGNVNKPSGQTTLIPPYSASDDYKSHVTSFIDEHDIGKVPGIGFKSAQKIRDHVLGRPAAFDAGIVYGGTKENVKVKDVRLFPSMGVEVLQKLLGSSGSPKDIATKVWSLINGIDNSEVAHAREEDSYIKLDTMAEVEKELRLLSRSLLSRIRIDLTCMADQDEVLGEEDGIEGATNGLHSSRQWLAYPKTLRLTTRPRPPLKPDGTRSRSFNRISRSCDMPSLGLNLAGSVENLSKVLVRETLIPLFHKLHPEKSGWDLSLMNLCATSISLTAASAKDGAGRDISKMFKMQEYVFKDWKIQDDDGAAPIETGSTASDEWDLRAMDIESHIATREALDIVIDSGKGQTDEETQDNENTWQSDDDLSGPNYTCTKCGSAMPDFAIAAHERYHSLPD
ncbi:MAG: hypothetical protein Q9209_005402 [Squamulea sp. 1 TL-2023]